MSKPQTPFHAKIVTLFPEMFPGMLGQALAGKSHDKGLWSFESLNPRAFASDVHKTVDDSPFGGGAGMLMKPDVLNAALASIKPLGRFIYMSPRGRVLDHQMALELSKEPVVTILCGPMKASISAFWMPMARKKYPLAIMSCPAESLQR